MRKKALLIFILIFALLLCSCQRKQQNTLEMLASLLNVSGESLEGNGIFYYSIVHPAFYDSQWLKKRGFYYAKENKYVLLFQLAVLRIFV